MDFMNELENFKKKFNKEIQTTLDQKGARFILLKSPLIQTELSNLRQNDCELYLWIENDGECSITVNDDICTHILLGDRKIVSNKKVYNNDDLSKYKGAVIACCVYLDSIDANNINKFLA